MTHEESKIQRACIEWFDYAYPKLRLNLFAIPNGGKRSKFAGGILKAEGMRSGVSDIFLAVSKEINIGREPENCIYDFGLFIEMKTPKGVQQDTQFEFQNAVEAEGYKYVICRSFDEFKKEIENYLK
jgi:hypothetical protein